MARIGCRDLRRKVWALGPRVAKGFGLKVALPYGRVVFQHVGLLYGNLRTWPCRGDAEEFDFSSHRRHKGLSIAMPFASALLFSA